VSEGVACLTDDGSGLCLAMIGKDRPLGRTGPGMWLTDGALTEVPFRKIVEVYGPDVALAVCARAAELVRFAVEEELVCAVQHGASQRLARWLQPLLEHDETATLTQTRLAQLSGLQRTSVCAAMATLQLTGALKVARGRIRLQDGDVLNRQACGCRANGGTGPGLAQSAGTGIEPLSQSVETASRQTG
jgi:hypothetical protein